MNTTACRFGTPLANAGLEWLPKVISGWEGTVPPAPTSVLGKRWAHVEVGIPCDMIYANFSKTPLRISGLRRRIPARARMRRHRRPVPQGRSKIAQHLSAGSSVGRPQVPKGRPKSPAPFCRPLRDWQPAKSRWLVAADVTQPHFPDGRARFHPRPLLCLVNDGPTWKSAFPVT